MTTRIAQETQQEFIITKQKDTRTQHSEFLGVDPTCQKGGIGTILLTRVLDVCLRRHQRITLIPIDDLRVINWYKKYGFVMIGSPIVSAYTGDLEQIMEYCPVHSIIHTVNNTEYNIKYKSNIVYV